MRISESWMRICFLGAMDISVFGSGDVFCEEGCFEIVEQEFRKCTENKDRIVLTD